MPLWVVETCGRLGAADLVDVEEAGGDGGDDRQDDDDQNQDDASRIASLLRC